MGLERYDFDIEYNGYEASLDEYPNQNGDWYRAADVDALLARIRAAVDVERASMRQTNGVVLPGAALDALLSGVSDGQA